MIARSLASIRSAWQDMQPALSNAHRFTTLGWQDVAARYRRSFIGAFWLTISMAILIAVIGLTFGTLFGQPVAGFIYQVGIGLVL
jgi:ABC-type polysaccharide/polyol phosphate export permease